jgi:hypothetical protein
MESEGSLLTSQEQATGTYPEPDESSLRPHMISLRFILILFYHSRFGLQNGLLPSGFPIKILYAFLTFPTQACPNHLSIPDLITLTILREDNKHSQCYANTQIT